MSQKRNPAITVIGIDVGKNSSHVVGLDGRSAIMLRQKWCAVCAFLLRCASSKIWQGSDAPLIDAEKLFRQPRDETET